MQRLSIRPWALGAGAALALMISAGAAKAEPQFAVRDGFSCAACHVNQSGGGKRTPFGTTYSQNSLPMFKISAADLEAHDVVSAALDPNLSDTVSVGANLRGDNVTMFKEESRFLRRVNDESPQQNSFSSSEGNFYIEARLVGEYLTLYFDQTFTPIVASREGFLLFRHPGWGAYVKAGKFLQPFGWRIFDDTTFTRSETGFRYNTPAQGVEVGIDKGVHHARIAVTNGPDQTIDKKVSGSLEIVFKPARLGVSYSYQEGASGPENIAGIYAGARAGRFTLLGEVDRIQKRVLGQETRQNVAMSQLYFLAARGVDLKLAFDYHDRNINIDEDHRSRLVMGVEYYPIAFLQLSLSYHRRWDMPQAPAAGKADSLVAQAHAFF